MFILMWIQSCCTWWQHWLDLSCLQNNVVSVVHLPPFLWNLVCLQYLMLSVYVFGYSHLHCWQSLGRVLKETTHAWALWSCCGSRFDLIYLVLDKPDEQNDRRLARHLVALHYEVPEVLYCSPLSCVFWKVISIKLWKSRAGGCNKD